MNRRLAAIAGLAVLPWSLVFAGSELTLVFSFGLVDPRPFYFTDLYSYLTLFTAGLPRFLESWPIGVGLYVLALGSALSGVVFDREDRRVTAVLLILVGATQLSFAWGFSRRLAQFAIPVATIYAWAVVWWHDWDSLTGLVERRE